MRTSPKCAECAQPIDANGQTTAFRITMGKVQYRAVRHIDASAVSLAAVVYVCEACAMKHETYAQFETLARKRNAN